MTRADSKIEKTIIDRIGDEPNFALAWAILRLATAHDRLALGVEELAAALESLVESK
jgi:hypothetical protein